MIERHPSGDVGRVEGSLHSRVALVEKIKGLREAEQHHRVDDAEGEHVAGDHRVDHGDERPGQFNRAGEEHEQEPGSWHCENQHRLFAVFVSEDAQRDADQDQQVGHEENQLGRILHQLLRERKETLVFDLETLLEHRVGDAVEDGRHLEAVAHEVDDVGAANQRCVAVARAQVNGHAQSEQVECQNQQPLQKLPLK